jgi:hypothetical protein
MLHETHNGSNSDTKISNPNLMLQNNNLPRQQHMFQTQISYLPNNNPENENNNPEFHLLLSFFQNKGKLSKIRMKFSVFLNSFSLLRSVAVIVPLRCGKTPLRCGFVAASRVI